MRSETAPAIRLEEYQPPAYRIDTVHLTIRLHPSDTEVVSVVSVAPQEGTAPGTPLQLDGDELTLRAVALNGKVLEESAYSVSSDRLEILAPPAEPFELSITTIIDPDANTKLMGLYRSSGTYCTQCEAEGFRRITYFLDRPDVLAVYTTRIEASRKDCPVLLANGNTMEAGDIADTDRHFSVWHDPHPKPAYLFALVAGDLARVPDRFATMSGKHVDLNIFVEHGNEALCGWAMDSLKRSMKWDEETFGLEYDLDVFNIVAVSDFNMGAMENKGLNVFNDKYVLADPETATDQDYANIEAVIAHEYFHNWTGNRITCRDWFQLCLKEGLTVFRDQEFTSDMRSRPVKRIADVRLLKSHQFPEDAGPLAHPVRPRVYHEINNFYTATVYEKGAEVVRMLKTVLGPADFRKGLDLYFERHDGDATTIEAFLSCFEDATGTDLGQFALWYEQAGTPVISVKTKHDPERCVFTVDLAQEIPPVPGQRKSRPGLVPLRFGLVDAQGRDMEPGSVEGIEIAGDVILLERARQKVTFSGVPSKPVLSLLRGFSAPVRLDQDQSERDLQHLAAHDSDPFNRWQAVQTLAMRELLRLTQQSRSNEALSPSHSVIDVFGKVLQDRDLDPALKALALTLPSEADIAQEIGKDVDPDAIHNARQTFRGEVAVRHSTALWTAVTDFMPSGPYSPDAKPAGMRALCNRALYYFAVSDADNAAEIVWDRFRGADNMTDRIACLTLIVHDGMPNKEEALNAYCLRHENSSLAMDKWFMVQATAPGPETLDLVRSLKTSSLFDETNPNRVRALLQSFATGNPTQFARIDGAGFEFVVAAVLELDKRNPQVASRLLTSFRSWRALESQRCALAESALLKISSCEELSRDSRDIIDRTLQ
nr:aminopeptidase N [uncultured Roseibium sp.]